MMNLSNTLASRSNARVQTALPAVTTRWAHTTWWTTSASRIKTTLLLIIGCLGANSAWAATSTPDTLKIEASDFRCILDMNPVRGFFVDNLIEGKLDETLAIARAEQGEYPPGSVVQLVPTEVMVKHPKGFNAATKDWEFFELNVTKDGSEIHKRGFVDVVNRFGGNCFACHVKAKPEFDMICESGHGCDPIPLTAAVLQLLQKTDARCGGRYTPTAQEVEILKKLSAR